MKKSLALCTAALVALGVALVPALGATADEIVEPPVAEMVEPAPAEEISAPVIEPAPETVAEAATFQVQSRVAPTAEVFWLVPEGVQVVDNRVGAEGFPQAHLADQIVPCERIAQVDLYPESAIPGLVADGWLTNGEDHSVVISWRWVYGPKCEEPEPIKLSPPSFVDRCSTGNQGDYGYDLTLPEDTEFVDYGDEGGDIDGVNYVWVVAQPLNGAVIAAPGEGDTYELTEYGARWAFTYTDELCPTAEVCEVASDGGTATNLNPLGWSGDGAFVEGGHNLPVDGGWVSSYIERDVNETLQQVLSGLDIDASPIQYVGLHFQVADGRWLTFEEEPSYGGKLWSNDAFAGVPAGMGYAAFGLPDEFVALNAELEVLKARLLYTHPEASETTVASASYSCAINRFDYEEPVVEPEYVTPPPATFDDVCDIDADAVNVPENTDGYFYEVDDQRVDGVGTVTVTAYANEGFAFEEEAVTTWSHDFTNEACPITDKPAPPASVPGELAYSGADGVMGGIAIVTFFLAVGALFAGIAAYRRRSDRKVQ